MSKPLVSVVMPVYNGEKFVAEAIESILNQTYTDWELIIVNDGSTDNTESVIKKFTQDKRIRYYKHNKNLGQSYAYNKGFFLAKGKYIAIQDSDDISLPHRLEREVEVLEKHPECKFVFSPAIFIDLKGMSFSKWGGDNLKEGSYTPYETFYKLYIEGNFIPNPSVLLRSPAPEYISMFKIVNDYLAYLKLCHKHKIYFISEPLVKMRRGKNHFSLCSKRTQLFCEERRLLKYIHKLYSKSKQLSVASSIYFQAMSHQLRKETIYYANQGFRWRSKLSAVKAFLYSPLDKRSWGFLLKIFFSEKVYKKILKIKKFLEKDYLKLSKDI